MAKKVFRVSGSFTQKHHRQPFSKEVVADTQAAAREQMLSLLGSKHAAPRRLITIDTVVELGTDQVQDPVVRYAAGLNA